MQNQKIDRRRTRSRFLVPASSKTEIPDLSSKKIELSTKQWFEKIHHFRVKFLQCSWNFTFPLSCTEPPKGEQTRFKIGIRIKEEGLLYPTQGRSIR